MLTIEFREFNSLLEYFKYLISIPFALVRCIYILLTIDGRVHIYTVINSIIIDYFTRSHFH